jgi:pilus assembly protein CpaC
LPNERIAVREANAGVILSGELSTSKAVTEAIAIANRFAPGNVSNLMTVTGSQQVMLEVMFAEVQRGFTRGMESELRVFGDGFFMGTDFVDTFARTFFTGGSFDIGSATVDLLFNFLENKNVAKILAEPTLVAMSGDSASFLAGGEFPVQVLGSDGGEGIEFKDFGVGLSFTPTVLSSGLINILVRPEVSVPVQSTVEGGAIAGSEVTLRTRRAETTVELGDGQSFMIAGMLSSTFSDDVTQLPWFGDIPILGALGRSAEYNRNETELVIIVTPHLVKPADAGMLALPNDNLYAPNEMQLFGFGMVEAPGPSRNVGLARPYGHILE